MMSDEPRIPSDDGNDKARDEIRRSIEGAEVMSDRRGETDGAPAAPDNESSGSERPAPKTSRKRSGVSAAPISRGTWVNNLQRDYKRSPIPNLTNALIALRTAPELTELLAFDEMKRSTILKSPIPVPSLSGDGFVARDLPRELDDVDAGRLQEWLQREIPTINLSTIHQAIEMRARERGFHPIRQYLDGLVWDAQQRLNNWLTYYLGVDASEYSSAVGRMFLTSMVARIYQPGCKVDYTPIFEARQGVRKSTFCQVLAGDPEYFSDSLPEIRNKDARQHLRGKWLIEFAELSSIQPSGVEANKAFLTRRYERYRPAYGRSEVIEPRQCVFVGTTNSVEYLKDETGNRRFWPMRTGAIDVDTLSRDRDQLFAEAVHLYKNNARWWPDEEFEEVHFKPEQDLRMQEDMWEDNIAHYLIGENAVYVQRIAVALGLPVEKWSNNTRERITGILTKLGWSRSEKRLSSGTPWLRPSDEEKSE